MQTDLLIIYFLIEINNNYNRKNTFPMNKFIIDTRHSDYA